MRDLRPEDSHKMSHDFPKFIPKGWGYELWIANTPEYCGKLLFFMKGKKLSWHYHNIKDETFFLSSGLLLVYYDWSDCLTLAGELDLEQVRSVVLEPGDVWHVPPGMRHRMIGLQESCLYEFSTHHEEEDSIRVIKGD